MRTVVLPPLLDPVKKALDTFKEQLPRDFTVRYLGGVLRYPCLQIAIREWMKAEMIDPDVRVWVSHDLNKLSPADRGEGQTVLSFAG